jgi:hypothetical protein
MSWMCLRRREGEGGHLEWQCPRPCWLNGLLSGPRPRAQVQGRAPRCVQLLQQLRGAHDLRVSADHGPQRLDGAKPDLMLDMWRWTSGLVEVWGLRAGKTRCKGRTY